MRRPVNPRGDRRRWNPEASGHYGATRLRAYTLRDSLRKKKVAADWLKMVSECADLASTGGTTKHRKRKNAARGGVFGTT
ncbi:hypothetical protein PAN31108_03773 [Pandoraea anhela]|uniref:Uncharacterized protein n=1 Tax=Pandoraea anhela TaxID=2508295 RepID=A0A5E4XBZ2_9BURK|nr:hypothetical protein PAN31108_03773 [Pandoraea anhela]